MFVEHSRSNRNTFESPQNFYDVFVFFKKFLYNFLCDVAKNMRKKRIQNLIVRNHIFRVDRICIGLWRWFIPSLLIVSCVYSTSFYDVAFNALQYEEAKKKKRKRNYYHYPSVAMSIPPEKKKKNSESREVHRRSQIIRNIYVAQINSR